MITFYKHIEISEINLTDISRILEIQRECKLSIWTANDYKRELAKTDTILLTVCLNKKIVGFINGRFLMSGLDIKGFPIFPEAELLNFGVIKEFQKKGLGGFLFDKFLQKIQDMGTETIWLEVRMSNLKALKFYKNREFVEIQKRKNFYTLPTEDAIVMKLTCTNKT